MIVSVMVMIVTQVRGGGCEVIVMIVTQVRVEDVG